jgi:putative acetyltransferase
MAARIATGSRSGNFFLSEHTNLTLRPAVAADTGGIIALIDAVYREYDDRVCLQAADGDLLDVNASYVAHGGAFVVLTDGQRILGTHAILPLSAQGICTFRRLYLDFSLRGRGWGEKLMEWAMEAARERGISRVEFWSDTRFSRAHRFFERHGFVRSGEVRDMEDGHLPYQEYFFFWELQRPLSP